MKPLISVVVPIYNEELVVKESHKRLKSVMDTCGERYEIIFINDGSRDKSASIVADICKHDKNIKLINFSRNFGHQPAITAGMDYALGDAIIIIDADLQDPPEVMLEMIELWKSGYQVIYGKRKSRKGETIFKKVTAKTYYRILRSMTNFDIPVDTGDFRLIDRKVCDAMKSLTEKNRYVRGLVSWVGFRQTSVEYERDERFAGETKYPFRKMLKLAMDGITAFSYKPLKLATYLGFAIAAASFLYMLYAMYKGFFTDETTEGWASIIAVISLSQGIILMMLGLMGEYIGRIYDEIKNRPIYIVNEIIENKEENQ